MADTIINDRVVKFKKRLVIERKRAKLSQEALAAKLNDLGYGKGQSAISEWETKERLPDIETIFALSKIFGCDCGYLLGDYDERTHNLTDICKETGLSEFTVSQLCTLQAWQANTELINVINALTYDFSYQRQGKFIAPIVFLINWYLSFNGDSKWQKSSAQVAINGTVCKADCNGHVPSLLNLNNSIIENAALEEIKNALKQLKASGIYLSNGDDNG